MIGKSADKSFAYILGVYLGDGCVVREKSGKDTFRLGTIDEDFAEATALALQDVSEQTISVNGPYRPSRKGSPFWNVYCGDSVLARKLVKDTNGKQRVPTYVFAWDQPLQLAFIEGLMDSEGFVAQKTATQSIQHTNRSFYMGYKSCDPWVADFLRILHSVGIRTGKVSQEKPRKPGYKTPTRFHIKMQSWVDSGARFRIARKQDRVDRWAACVPYSERRRHPRRLVSETIRQTPDG